MIFFSKKRFVYCTCCVLFVLHLNVSAQDSLLQNAIDKVDNFKNFSYRSNYKMKELWTSDTIAAQYNSLFIKEPGDKKFGYLLNVQTLNDSNKLTDIDLYNGQNLIHFKPGDSTYNVQEELSFNMQSSLLGCMQWLQSRLKAHSVKIKIDRDTVINTSRCSHIVATVYDTIIDNERNYTNAHLYIDEISGMPAIIVVTSRSTEFGNGVSTYYSETDFFDYKINQTNVGAASLVIPVGLQKQKAQPELAIKASELLPLKSIAPHWILYDSEGKILSLTKLKGKIILIDFFFIGCGNCLEALKPLSKLHEKYKTRNVTIASMTFRDNKEASAKFKKIYNINYPIYIDADKVVKAYKVKAFPTFYFIDKDGKIANTIAGYDADFETRATSTIDKLLTK